MIGANWVTVSPAKTKLAVFESYKNLASDLFVQYYPK
jgi:hypothetical protein